MRLASLKRLNAEQRAFQERLTTERGGAHGPFEVLLRSPLAGQRVEELATYCMRDCELPLRLLELALLIAARHCDAQHSWTAHVDQAVAAGLDRAAVERLARAEEPRFPRADEVLLYRFAQQALREHFVDDDTYGAALVEFGEQVLVDLVVSLGTFATLALLLNTFEVDLRPGVEPPFPDVRGFRRVPPTHS
ncbi:carboxymuconolactone decarboxylase family protein [Streptomyces sp. NBC_01361]|uniref:carboxymuconolactone decarboxylase family protein n=1 Tax=Streptomyces sp. NBC_01361 TaxID=2903838 RepID=UPI002E37D729|nr:carboxymuconolactone decarboxylase family protein [Streptomyces sp. NBC_01361]